MKRKSTFIAYIACSLVALLFCFAVAVCFQGLASPQTVAATGHTTIVLDAGHGGMDGGVVGKATGVKESDLNLDIVFCIKDKLEDMGFEVVLTRKTQGGLYDSLAKGFKRQDMQRRKQVINEASPKLVLSIHQNYYPSSRLRGAQVFFDENNGAGRALSSALQVRLNALYEKEGVKGRTESRADFFMLNCHSFPAALIECGFLSSERDEKLLLSPAFRENLSSAIAVGVVDYLSAFSA